MEYRQGSILVCRLSLGYIWTTKIRHRKAQSSYGLGSHGGGEGSRTPVLIIENTPIQESGISILIYLFRQHSVNSTSFKPLFQTSISFVQLPNRSTTSFSALYTIPHQHRHTLHMHRMRKHIHRRYLHRSVPAILQQPQIPCQCRRIAANIHHSLRLHL